MHYYRSFTICMHQSLKNTHQNSSCNQGQKWLTHLSKTPAFSNNFIHLIIYFCLNAVNPPTRKSMLFVVKEVLEGLRPGSDPKLFKSRTMHLVWYMRRLVSESKLFQSRSKIEIPGWARWEEWPSHSKSKKAFLIKLLVQTLYFSCT